MSPRTRSLLTALPLLLLGACFALALGGKEKPATFRAGAAVVDIAPQRYPVRVNGMFTERTPDKVVDPLTARALALDDGTTRLVFCVVDTCMMPRDLIDAAKKTASEATSIPTERMLVSATHTHSAPSAMGCLGSRQDPEYAAMLPGKIAAAIIAAVQNLQPARAGWTAFDDWDHTHNRRWIRRPDRMLTDPFGQPNVRANMHPGHQSADVTGPSGPVDPQISVLAVETADGRPLALLANYSMHYQGSPMLSSDYFGRFAVHIGKMLGAGESFVGIMSQGTSGDLWSGDYSRPAGQALSYDAYAEEIARRVAAAYKKIEWKTEVPLAMAEAVMELKWRVPDEKRLQWAREVQTKLGDKLPQNHPEVYALEAIYLHERQKTELKLQAVRVGDMGITALPNEVFCLTGLKLKARSPFPVTMNIELANGADGYIPPPEQHALGGYTTWPARTAGLEVEAEPKITAAVTTLLEKVSGKPARKEQPASTDYAKAVSAAEPLAFWRMEEMDAGRAHDETAKHPAALEPGVAVYLPGMGEVPRTAPQSRAFHFAGGRMKSKVPPGDKYSVAFWLWNGLPADARPVTGYAFSRGKDGDKLAAGEHLGIGGTYKPEAQGRLILFNGNAADQLLAGKTKLALKAWHHVVFVREGAKVRVHLDGKPVPDMEGELPLTVPAGEQSVFIGGRCDNLFNWEGKLDEFAIFDRALTGSEASQLYQASKMTPPATVLAPEFPPLSPEESLTKIHVPAGFKVELVACEPNVLDPVAIDWDLAGRLWVVEMADYPSGMKDGLPGGRVRVLEDTDGDGKFEKSTLFAERLNFPTGLLTWRDGVIVTAAPDILFLKDTDGDGKADVREKIISGLSEGNQQLRANGLRWGLDNRVYCAAGGHHGSHAADTVLHSHQQGQDVPVGSRDFSFDPDVGDVRPESGPSQFGRNRDDGGSWFGTQNSRALWHYVFFPDRYLYRAPYIPAPNPTHLIVGPLNAPVYPVSPPEKRFHSFENAGHFTSACSGMIYRDELLWPRREHELDAFTCEPFHNLVQHNILMEDGVTWKAQRAPGEEKHDFFASEDRWCRPVMTRTGPDGALWVVDMYRYMIEHPAWLPENGRAELLPHYRLGDDKGRIYRVFPDGKTPPRKVKPLEKLAMPELVAALDSPNEWQRDKAHMASFWLRSTPNPKDRREWRSWTSEDAAAATLVLSRALEHSNPLVRLHALCLMSGFHMIHFVNLPDRLKDKDPRVRRVALEMAEVYVRPETLPAAAALAKDPDPKVRLQFALSAGSWSSAPGIRSNGSKRDRAAIADALGNLATSEHENPWIRTAVIMSSPAHCLSLCERFSKASGPAFEAYADGLTTVALRENDRLALAAMLRPALTPKEGIFTADQIRRLIRVVDALWAENKNLTNLTAAADELTDVLQGADTMLAYARKSASDESAAAELRIAAAALLIRNTNERSPATQLLRTWLKPAGESALQLAAVRVLSASGDSAVPGILLAEMNTLSPRTGAAAVDALMSREVWTTALLNAIKDGAGITLDAVQRARLLKHSSEEIRGLAAAVLTADLSRRAVLEHFRAALALKGDIARGKVVFGTRCIACHKLDDAGLDIGPDLKSVVSHPPEKILTNIIDPSLDVQPGFFAFQAKLKDGSELYGLVTSETGNSVTFKLTDGSTRLVARGDLADFKSTGQSLMPAGLETGMTPQEMADLLAWLKK